MSASSALQPSQPPHLEVWADSFKEGEWFVQTLATQLTEELHVDYHHNFLPVFRFVRNGQMRFSGVVYGGYRGWSPLPAPIKSLLEFGKPDIVLFDRAHDRIFFAVEETAAVPTGNQSLQRLERVQFAAQSRIPFVYLLTEYGLHKDGGARRSSIWPSYLALKLSSQYRVPSLTLLYGDGTHPEDYDVGMGVADLATVAALFVRDWLGEDVEALKQKEFARIFQQMGAFIQSHAEEISPHLPGRALLTSPQFLQFIAQRTASLDV